MASNNRTGPFDGNIAHSFLWPIKWLLSALAIYIFLGLLSIVVVLLWANFVWQNPIDASDILFKTEAARVLSMENLHFGDFLTTLVEFTMRWTYWLFFKFTTIHDATYAYLAGYQVNDVDFMFFKTFIAKNVHQIYVAMNMNRVYGIRIGYFLSSLPLFWLVYVVALTDGLTERYIRRACAGRESADMNKLGKLSKLMFFATGVTLYLCLPVPINPFWLIAPLTLIYAVGTRVQWQFYKKYL